MDLNTKELFLEQALQLFENIEKEDLLTNETYKEIYERLTHVKVPQVKVQVHRLLGNFFFLNGDYFASNKHYVLATKDMLNFFELMSYLDTSVQTGRIAEQNELIQYSIDRMIKEKKINLADQFIEKLEAIHTPKQDLLRLNSFLLILTGNSKYGEEVFNKKEMVEESIILKLATKLEFWRKDPQVLKLILHIDPLSYNECNSQIKDRIKFYGLNYFHKELILSITTFDWCSFINFLLKIELAISYEEINRLVFDFNLEVDNALLQQLKALAGENNKMLKVEQVMGEIGINNISTQGSFSEGSLDGMTLTQMALDFGSRHRHDIPTQKFLTKIAHASPVAALEYITELEDSVVDGIIESLEQELVGFDGDGDPEEIRKQVDRGYLVIKICIQAKRYIKATKIMDYVLKNFELLNREQAAFYRLKREIHYRWQKE